MFKKRLLIMVALFSLLASAGGWALSEVKNQGPRRIPLTDFFRNPQMTDFAL